MASEPIATDTSTSEYSRGPVVVLSYAGAGAELLTRILSLSRSLACTSGTGILPLCHSAVVTWQSAERRQSDLSPLAAKSVRSMASMIIAVIQAQTGARRWCETALAPSVVASTFLRLFPSTAFLCLHRRLSSVLIDSLAAYPWGLGSSPFWPHAAMYPGNSVAAIAAYWVSHTEQMLEFEAAHPRSCRRIRYEDLETSTGEQAAEIFSHLGLEPVDLTMLREPPPDLLDPARRQRPGPAMPVPRDHLPHQLRTRVAELHDQLDYPSWPDLS